jgi:hypothetical protein
LGYLEAKAKTEADYKDRSRLQRQKQITKTEADYKDRSRLPSGMTERRGRATEKARATATATTKRGGSFATLRMTVEVGMMAYWS